jgi:hypothetical protein
MMIEVVEKVETLTRDDMDMLVRCLTAECNEFNVESMNDLGYEDERLGAEFLNNKEL